MIANKPEIITINKPVEEAIKRVQKIDLFIIASSLVSRKPEYEVSVHKLVDIYAKWLALRMVYGRLLTPQNSQIDEMWHEHILHTEQYFTDCEYLFGSYMHHYPHPRNDSVATAEELSRFEGMKELWKQHFYETIEFSGRLICN